MRHASSRNQRTKGCKVKQFLQFCLLAVICIWLLYQLKHSYDKKQAFEEQNKKIFDRVAENGADFFKLGRKDLPPSEEMGSANETQNKEDENEEVEEEEEQETKQEAMNEEGRGAQDDEIDETGDQEGADEEAEHGEESAEEEVKGARVDGTDLLDDEEHGGDSLEAQEEHYKKDDASSDVHHDNQVTETVFGNGDTRNLDEAQMEDMEEKDVEREIAANMEKKDVERENLANDTVEGSKGNGDSVGTADGSNGNVSSAVLGGNETTPNGTLSMNETFAEKSEPEVGGVKFEVGSISNSTPSEHDSQIELHSNSTASAESNNQMELQTNSSYVPTNQMETHNNSIEVDAVINVPLQNENVKLDSGQYQNATGTPREDNPNLADVVLEQPEKSDRRKNENAEQGESNDPSETEKSNTSENRDAAHGESDVNTSENGDAAQGESDKSSHDTVTDEETEARTDLSTLPNIENRAKNDEDEATEL